MAGQQGRYQTQWAAQFYAAAELTRRGYLVSLTLGNAPVADLLAISPKGAQFEIDVKGQATKNFWLLQRRSPDRKLLFYVLVYFPRNNQIPEFFVLTSSEAMRHREEYREHIESKSGP